MTAMTDDHVLTIRDHRLIVGAARCSCGRWEIGGDLESVGIIELQHAEHVQRVADFHALEELLNQAGTTPDINGDTWIDAEAAIVRLRASWGDV